MKVSPVNTHIWCDQCEAIKPMVKDALFGKDTTGKFGYPTDLMCADCKLVIATTFTPLFVSSDIEERNV